VRENNKINAKCVKTDKCENEKCGPNSYFSDCGYECPKTCETLDEDIVCTKRCRKGCFCFEGYVKDGDDRCIEENECPQFELISGRSIAIPVPMSEDQQSEVVLMGGKSAAIPVSEDQDFELDDDYDLIHEPISSKIDEFDAYLEGQFDDFIIGIN